ncbi:MAG: YiiX/YebB-like N1pC/P60 family cysteine hydrolase [Gimesia sp.]
MSLFLSIAVLASTPMATQRIEQSVQAVKPQMKSNFTTFDQLANSLSSRVQTGTLLFSKGDCLAVRIYTQSAYTHVAMIVIRNGEPLVYDSMNGVGVRCLPLKKYLNTQRPATIHLFQPTTPFGAAMTSQYERYLDHKLGTPYAIRHHLTGSQANGVHCAEYAIDALSACHLMKVKHSSKVSPASLVTGIVNSNRYTPSITFALKRPPLIAEKPRGWCQQLWVDTKNCTSACCIKLRGWVLCQ